MRWIHDAVVASTSTGVRVSHRALTALGIDRREYHRYLPGNNAHPLLYTLTTWAVLMTIYAGTVALAQW
jgi:hypothetical protein